MDDGQSQNKGTDWTYTGGEQGQAKQAHIDAIQWSASEYISHEKDPIWYAAISAASTATAAIIYLITKELLASITILTVAFSAIFFAGRKPATKNYSLSDSGLSVDGKHYHLSDFRSFSIVEEGAINSIWLKPLGRFKPMMILYFAPEDEDKIATALGNLLPYEQRELDSIDRLTRRIRF